MYNIKKSYENKPSRNEVEEKGLSLEDAKLQLEWNANLWKKNGGSIIEKTDDTLICEEPDGSEVITWSLEKVEDE